MQIAFVLFCAFIIEPKYRKIFRLPDGQFKAIATKHYGIIEKDGIFVHPTKYDKISQVVDKSKGFGNYEYILKLEYGDTIEYLDKDGEWLKKAEME